MADSCGHNFCQDCLLHVANGQNEWYCPEGRSVQSRQPDQLMRNRFIERAVESYNAASNQSEASLCSHHNLELSLCKYSKKTSIRSNSGDRLVKWKF